MNSSEFGPLYLLSPTEATEDVPHERRPGNPPIYFALPSNPYAHTEPSQQIMSSAKGYPVQWGKRAYGAYKNTQPDPMVSTGQARVSDVELPRVKRANIFLWCSAILCTLITILIIVLGFVMLVVYLVFHPARLPRFAVETGKINGIRLDQRSYFMYSEMIFLAKFENSNDKVDLEYEYINFKLYFEGQVIATQLMEPFAQRRGTWNLTVLRMISTATELTPKRGQLLIVQASQNDISFRLEGALRTRVRLGGIRHVTYWLRPTCQMGFTSPPNGSMVRHRCTTRWSP